MRLVMVAIPFESITKVRSNLGAKCMIKVFFS